MKWKVRCVLCNHVSEMKLPWFDVHTSVIAVYIEEYKCPKCGRSSDFRILEITDTSV